MWSDDQSNCQRSAVSSGPCVVRQVKKKGSFHWNKPTAVLDFPAPVTKYQPQINQNPLTERSYLVTFTPYLLLIVNQFDIIFFFNMQMQINKCDRTNIRLQEGVGRSKCVYVLLLDDWLMWKVKESVQMWHPLSLDPWTRSGKSLLEKRRNLKYNHIFLIMAELTWSDWTCFIFSTRLAQCVKTVRQSASSLLHVNQATSDFLEKC